MKKQKSTIENVIITLENNSCYECSWGCESPVKCDCPTCFYKDAMSKAIEYLKAYRDDKDELTALRAYWAEQQENPPLTWDELKQMVGKPVWIDGSAFADGFWAIPYMFSDSGGSEYFFAQGEQYWKEHMRDKDDGVSWQAYRKERK